jgi:hypothetical protein
MNSASPNVNYESPPVAETEIEGTAYRVDAGKQGAALCISTRDPSGWDWAFLCEVRWDGTEVRSKTLDREVRLALSRVIASAIQDL